MKRVAVDRSAVREKMRELLDETPEVAAQPDLIVLGVAHMRLAIGMLRQASVTVEGIEKVCSDYLDEVAFDPEAADEAVVESEDDVDDRVLSELWESTARRWSA